MAKRKLINRENVVQYNLEDANSTEEHYMFIQEMALYYQQQGIGDGSVHNTLIYVLARAVNVDLNPFKPQSQNLNIIAHVPIEVDRKITAIAESLSITKPEALRTILDIYMTKTAKTRKNTGKLINPAHYISLIEFRRTAPGKPIAHQTVQEAINKGVIKETISFGTGLNNRYIDKTRYYIDDKRKIRDRLKEKSE